MSSDEDDYMSDKFLAKETEDVRPGIPKRKTEEHALEQYKKKLKSQIPNKHALESLKRDEGLNTAISSTNKGFQMLVKMGYKSGTSLGTSNTGIVEPIGINLKADRGGLGKLAKPKPGKRTTPKVEVTKEMEQSYRKAVQEKKHIQMIRKFYYKAQTSCLHLDKQNNLILPVREFFWPKHVLEDINNKEKRKKAIDDVDREYNLEDCGSADDDEEEEEVINEELLQDILSYLRETYYYCIYCAAKAVDEDDLNSFCPGESYDDHDMD